MKLMEGHDLQDEKLQRKFSIIGAGMGTADTLTGEAVRTLADADTVFATKRLAALTPKAEVWRGKPRAGIVQHAVYVRKMRCFVRKSVF